MSHKKKSPPSLQPKKLPAQQRGADTYERILQVAAEMLGEVGIERLSTNQICLKAGLTPPALYQYFPNKYAVLYALGQRLMEQQNACIEKWITVPVLGGDPEALTAAVAGLLTDAYMVTQQFPGGVWVMRALYAVPTLEEVRLSSHREVARQLAHMLAEAHPQADATALLLFSRTAVELVYAAIGMLFDEALPLPAATHMVAAMVTTPLRTLCAPPAPAPALA